MVHGFGSSGLSRQLLQRYDPFCFLFLQSLVMQFGLSSGWSVAMVVLGEMTPSTLVFASFDSVLVPPISDFVDCVVVVVDADEVFSSSLFFPLLLLVEVVAAADFIPPEFCFIVCDLLSFVWVVGLAVGLFCITVVDDPENILLAICSFFLTAINDR
jgi:hypothetical protein